MAVNVAINGFGRIGRAFFRLACKDKGINIVAMNDLADLKTLAHLLRHDSVHGALPDSVEVSSPGLIVGGKPVHAFCEKEPSRLPWKKLGIAVVVESTGAFTRREGAEQHIAAGAGNVIISAPSKSEDVRTFVLGANEHEFDKKKDRVCSMASCTTNCLVPLAKVLNDNFGIEHGLMTTVHAYTSSQPSIDMPGKDLRRARAAALNIIPTTTGAAVAVTKVLPELKRKLNGMAMRVPVADGSLVDLVAQLSKDAGVEEINAAFKKAADGRFKGILEYSTEPLVSTDIIGNRHACVFDSLLTMSPGNGFVKVFGWYDNEIGYSQMLVNFVKYIGKG